MRCVPWTRTERCLCVVPVAGQCGASPLEGGAVCPWDPQAEGQRERGGEVATCSWGEHWLEEVVMHATFWYVETSWVRFGDGAWR